MCRGESADQPTQPGARNWDTQTGSGRADFATPPSIFYTYAFVIIIILKGHDKSYLDEKQKNVGPCSQDYWLKRKYVSQ